MTISTKGVLSAIEGFIADYAEREPTVALGLFGGWARYEASEYSAIDILAVDGSSDFEFHELVEHGGLLLDVDRIPWRWVGGVVVPEVDHRLHEVLVLRDPDGVLRKAKGFVEGNYRAPGRVEVRTEGYLTTADMYLSRSYSAMTRRDLETASLFAAVSLEPVAHLLMDVAGVPIDRGALVWNLRRACERLRTMDVYRAFIGVTRLAQLEVAGVEECILRFEEIWQGVAGSMREGRGIVGDMHERLRRDIEYVTSPAVPGLVVGRAREMLGMNNHVGAAAFVRGWLLPLLEDYAWVFAARQGEKLDYTTLFRTLADGGGGVHGGAVAAFDLVGLDEGEASQRLERARAVVSRVRAARQGLIERFVGRGGIN
jgi:hypothetical protein